MKKIFIGLILGIFLSIATSVIATSPFIGKEIQGSFPVLLDDESLEQEAIIIDGISFLPVRLVSEKLGLDVEFENDIVILNRNKNQIIEEPPEVNQEEQKEGDLKLLVRGLDMVESDLKNIEINIPHYDISYKVRLDQIEKIEQKDELTKEEEQMIEEYRQAANGLQTELKRLKAKKEERESQLSILQSQSPENLSNEAKIIILSLLVEKRKSQVESLEERQRFNESEEQINQIKEEILELESKIEQLQASE